MENGQSALSSCRRDPVPDMSVILTVCYLDDIHFVICLFFCVQIIGVSVSLSITDSRGGGGGGGGSS